MQIRTAGELRGFLADIMVGVRDGKVECGQAAAISKIAAQINQSLAVEVNTALQLEKMGKDRPVAGSMLIGSTPSEDAAPQALSAPAEPSLSAEQVPGEPPFASDEDDTRTKWVEAAVRHVEKLKKADELDLFITRQCDKLELLMEERPDLHAQLTIAINESRERMRPNQMDRIDHKLRDDLQWCDQCDMMVAPEDSAGCKSRFCSLKVSA